jgi:glycerol uptake facilitator-like aquaporin
MTVGAWVTKKIDWLSAVVYIAAQVLGAAAAFLVLDTFLKANAPTAAQIAAGATAPSLFQAASVAAGKEWFVFFTELLGTAVLALGVATAIRYMRNRAVAAFSAGFALLIAFYVTMSLTTSLLEKSGVTLTFLNPAIALVTNGLSWKLWPISIYVVAPVIGAVVGFVLSDYLHSQSAACDCEECK